MNSKQIAAAVSLAFAAAGAMASEATQFVDPVSTLSRAGVATVEAARHQAPVARVVSNQEATQFADAPAISRDRAEVRAEGRAAARNHQFDSLNVGA